MGTSKQKWPSYLKNFISWWSFELFFFHYFNNFAIRVLCRYLVLNIRDCTTENIIRFFPKVSAGNILFKVVYLMKVLKYGKFCTSFENEDLIQLITFVGKNLFRWMLERRWKSFNTWKCRNIKEVTFRCKEFSNWQC